MAATDGTTDAEQVENGKAADRPPLPPDHPGQESEGVPSRRETRRALAAMEGTDRESSGELRLRDDPADAGDETREDDRPAPSGTREADAADRCGEHTDRPHEVTRPQMTQDYYPNIPPTVQDRYLIRDQSNPVPLFDGPPARDQVVQGAVGDCGVIAVLGAVAEHRPEAIKDAIRQVDDGDYEITLYEITQATSADPVARPTGKMTSYRMSDELPVRTDLPARPPAGADAGSCGWPALIEKVIAAEDQIWNTPQKADWNLAWTTWHKSAVDRERMDVGLGPSPDKAPMGYNRLDIGSTAHQQADVLAKLTGEDAEVRHIPDEEQGEEALLDELRGRLRAGKPVLVGTRHLRAPDERFPNRLEPGHAYEVTRVDGERVHLRNPWGVRHPEPLDTKTFWEYYRSYNRDGTRDGHYTTLK